MTEVQRVKVVRKSLKLTQKEFGETIGLTQGGYSDIERGKNGISSRIKLFLKQIHNINLHWLETGEGEMYSTEITDEYDEFNLLDQESKQSELEKLQIEMDKLKQENARLQIENKLYAELTKAKDKTIETLENQIDQLKNKY